MKKALSLILSLLMVCSLAACGGGKTGESANTPNGEAPAQETKKVESMVYLTATTDNEYFINVAHGCQQFCDENGIKFEFMGCNYDAAEQYSQMENYMAKGVDAFALWMSTP